MLTVVFSSFRGFVSALSLAAQQSSTRRIWKPLADTKGELTTDTADLKMSENALAEDTAHNA